MPFYDYHCLDCDHSFEAMHKFGEPGPSACPACAQGRVEKMLSAPALGGSSGAPSAGGGGGGGGHVHGPGCRH